jgi:hypothetical protein
VVPGNEVVVIRRVAGWIWIESVLAVLIPALSVTCMENPKMPLLKGVPVIVPVVFRFSPPGRVPVLRDHEYGGVPPEAASVCE